MIGLTLAVAALATRVPRWSIALFFLFWFPLNYVIMKPKPHELRAHGDQVRQHVTGLLEYAKHVPKLKAVVVQGTRHSWLPGEFTERFIRSLDWTSTSSGTRIHPRKL